MGNKLTICTFVAAAICALTSSANAAEHPDAARYSAADQAALTALIKRVIPAEPRKKRIRQRRCNPRKQTLCGMPDILAEAWNAAIEHEVAKRMHRYE